MSDEEFAGKDWVGRSRFVESGVGSVWKVIRSRIFESRGLHPVVVFDLDSTLYDVRPRTRAIILEWLHSSADSGSQLAELLSTLQLDDIHHGVEDTVDRLGAKIDGDLEQDVKHLKRFWSERFFTGQYISHDKAYPDAVARVQELYEAGAEVFYLSGRSHDLTFRESFCRLTEDGFPVEESQLILKHHRWTKDFKFKAEAMRTLRNTHYVLATLENEPVNVVMFQKLLPEAVHVFVDTVYSARPAPGADGLYRISGYSSGENG